MNKLKVKSEKLKCHEEESPIYLIKLMVVFFVASLLLCSCSKAYEPIGVKKRTKKKCDCSKWTYTEPQILPAGTGGSGNADLYVFDLV